MKHLYFSILIGCILIFTACNDWLDVKPRSETRAEILFETEDGFKSALTGVYIKLADPNLYGKNTSLYLPEALARNWFIPNYNTAPGENTKFLMGNMLFKLSEYDYTYPDIESLINTVWSNYYNCVVQINNILENLEGSKIYFSYNNDRLIKGEALGLRAFIHLEVLRFYGPVPSTLTGDQPDIIPYVTEMTKDPNKLISKSYQEVLLLLEKDLNDAEKLLEDIDPILHYNNVDLNREFNAGNDIPKDEWHLYRQNRFNYYAVLGAKARFYHWTGNKEKAALYAKKVIEAVNEKGTKKFPLATKDTYGTTGNLVMLGEHLFSLHNPSLQNIVQSLFVDEDPLFQQRKAPIEEAYEVGIHKSDIRLQEGVCWDFDKSSANRNNHFLKYTKNNNAKAKNLIPLMRVSEMYFIAIENLPAGAQTTTLFTEFCVARSLDASIFNSLTDETAVISRMEKEYRKDFFGEGQMFFFYKRHNYRTFLWPIRFEVPNNAYVLPKPKGQLSFE